MDMEKLTLQHTRRTAQSWVLPSYMFRLLTVAIFTELNIKRTQAALSDVGSWYFPILEL